MASEEGAVRLGGTMVVLVVCLAAAASPVKAAGIRQLGLMPQPSPSLAFPFSFSEHFLERMSNSVGMREACFHHDGHLDSDDRRDRRFRLNGKTPIRRFARQLNFEYDAGSSYLEIPSWWIPDVNPS